MKLVSKMSKLKMQVDDNELEWQKGFESPYGATATCWNVPSDVFQHLQKVLNSFRRFGQKVLRFRFIDMEKRFDWIMIA